MSKKWTNKVAHLPQDITIDRVEEHSDSVELFISYPEYERICPECGSHDCVRHDSGKYETVRHIVSGNKGLLLSFHVSRCRCKSCGKTFFQEPYFVQPGLKLTQAAYVAVCEALMTNKSIKQIALDTGTTESIVMSVLNYVDFTITSLPVTLCIDEFDGSTGYWNAETKKWDINQFHCNIADEDHGCVVDILFKKDAASVKEYLKSFSLVTRRKVKYYCCDMADGFISAAKQCLPNAIVCVDNFHITNLLKRNVDDARIALQKSVLKQASVETDEEKRNDLLQMYRLIKSSNHLLASSNINKQSLDKKRQQTRLERIERILELSDDLKEAYNAYQELLIILHTSGYTVQRTLLSEWLEKYTESANKGTRRCANTIRHYRTYIHNAWKYSKSNASCEGLNNKIKVLKRTGFGGHSFPNFRQRVLFHCGSTKVVRSTYSIASQKRSNKRSSRYSHAC